MNRTVHEHAANKPTYFLHVRQLGPLQRKHIIGNIKSSSSSSSPCRCPGRSSPRYRGWPCPDQSPRPRISGPDAPPRRTQTSPRASARRPSTCWFLDSSAQLKKWEFKFQVFDTDPIVHTCVQWCAPEASPWRVHSPYSVEVTSELHEATLPPLGREVGYRPPDILLGIIDLR